MENVIKLLSEKYNFKYEEALVYIKQQTVNINNMKSIHDEYNLDNINFQLPYYGVINEKCCKGIIFNSGLYTQCKINTNLEFCKTCAAQKYGSIYDRRKYSLGKFVCKNGKTEKSYIAYLKTINVNIDYVKELFKRNNIDYPIEYEKKTRGRPKQEKSKKTKEEELEERIEKKERERVKISGEEYIKKGEIIENKITNEIVGILKLGKIEKI